MADKDANSYRIPMNRFVTFLIILDIFDDESVNSTFRNKKIAGPIWPINN